MMARREQAMDQQLQPVRSADSEKAWLAALVDAMELVSRLEIPSAPCDASSLVALRAQLMRSGRQPNRSEAQVPRQALQ